ncbi:hypothetical protein Tco_0724593 [Tanacetum coccineum]
MQISLTNVKAKQALFVQCSSSLVLSSKEFDHNVQNSDSRPQQWYRQASMLVPKGCSSSSQDSYNNDKVGEFLFSFTLAMLRTTGVENLKRNGMDKGINKMMPSPHKTLKAEVKEEKPGNTYAVRIHNVLIADIENDIMDPVMLMHKPFPAIWALPQTDTMYHLSRSYTPLNLIPSTPFVLEYPSSSPIPVVDSDFLVEEVDTFLVSEDSIPPGIESDLDSEGDIVFLDNLLKEDLIPEYERFTFDIEPDAPVINNFDELNEDEYFDPGGGEIDVSQNVEDDDSFTFVIQTFLPFLTYPVDSPLLLSTRSEDTIFDPGIST